MGFVELEVKEAADQTTMHCRPLKQRRAGFERFGGLIAEHSLGLRVIGDPMSGAIRDYGDVSPVEAHWHIVVEQ